MSSYERVAEDILYVREKEGRFPVRVEHYFPLYLIIGKGQDKKEAVYVTEDLSDILYIKLNMIGKPKVNILEDMKQLNSEDVLLNVKYDIHGKTETLTKGKAKELLSKELGVKYSKTCCGVESDYGSDIKSCIMCGKEEEYVIDSLLGRGVFKEG